MTEYDANAGKAEKEVPTFKLGEKTFLAESLTEAGTSIINDVQKVDNLLSQQKLMVSVSTLAKGKLLEELEKESVNFTEAPESGE